MPITKPASDVMPNVGFRKNRSGISAAAPIIASASRNNTSPAAPIT